MKNWLVFFFLTISFCVLGQSITVKELAFVPNEKLTYIASYNMKGLMTELASIDMDVIDVPGKKKPVYRLKFTANTLTSWDNYVKVRHAYQTYVDPTSLKPLIMAQDSDVKGITTKGKYTFKHKSGIAELEIEKSGAPPVNRNLNIKTNTFDIVSLIYLSRCLDYPTFKIGQTVPLSVAFLERLVEFNIKYVGKETIKTKAMGSKECYKIALVLNQKFIVEPNVTFIWLTADENRVPVLISTVYKEGKAQVELSKYEGLKK